MKHGEPLFDSVQVEELERLVGSATGAELIGTFLGSLRELTGRIEEARRTRDAEALRAVVHSLAGAALSIGARPLGLEARRIQEDCDRGEGDAALARAEATLDLAARTDDAFVRFLADRQRDA